MPEFEILPYHIDIWKVPAKMALTFRGRKKLSLSKDIKGSPVLGSCTSVLYNWLKKVQIHNVQSQRGCLKFSLKFRHPKSLCDLTEATNTKGQIKFGPK